jgi:hypothetical protein
MPAKKRAAPAAATATAAFPPTAPLAVADTAPAPLTIPLTLALTLEADLERERAERARQEKARARAAKAKATREANKAAKAAAGVAMAASAGGGSGAAARRRKTITLPSSFRVLSIDVGLRNLGLAVVKLVDEEGCVQLRRELDRTDNPLAAITASAPERVLSAQGISSPSPPPPAPLPDCPPCLCELLRGRVYIEHAENVDVLEENGCSAKNSKSIGPLRQVSFWHGSMMRRAALFLDSPPDVVVVEVQDGGNATMRQMSTGIVGLFMGHFEARHRDGHIPKVPAFTMVRGDMKLKVSEVLLRAFSHEPTTSPTSSAAIGVTPSGSVGAAAEQAIIPQPPPPPPASVCPAPPEYLRKVNPRRYFAMLRAHKESGASVAAEGAAEEEQEDEDVATLNPAAKRRRASAGRSKVAYELRKRTAVAAFEHYMEQTLASAPHLMCRELRTGWKHYTQKKRRDVSDAVLQGLYVLARDLKIELE